MLQTLGRSAMTGQVNGSFRSVMWISAVGAAGLLSACGGGSGSQSGSAVAVAPAPTPTATPTSVPTPTASPTPTVSGPLAARGGVGDQLEGPSFCVRGTLVYNQPGSASPGLVGLSDLKMAELVLPTFGVTLAGTDAYNIGFEGPELRPVDKIAPETPLFDQFYQGEDSVEFDIYRNTGFIVVERAALGFYSDTIHFCPFAGGAPPSQLPTGGTTAYRGIADGVAIVGGQAKRLFGSAATLTIDHATGKGTVTLDLAHSLDSGQAFGAFSTAVLQEFDFAPIVATVSGANGRFSGTLRNSSGDLTGPIEGSLFAPGGPAAGVSFVLNDASGIRVVGAAVFKSD